jgi:hypothetical protein
MRLFALILTFATCIAPAMVHSQTGNSQAHRFAALRADGNGVAALQHRTTVKVSNEPLEDALRTLLGQAQLGVTIDRELPGLRRRVTLNAELPLAEAILRLLAGSALQLMVADNGQTVLLRTSAPAVPVRGTVAGQVLEAGGDVVAHAGVQLVGARAATNTDAFGRFSLRLPAGEHTLELSALGYAPAQVAVRVAPDSTTNMMVQLELAPTPLAQEVVTPGFYGIMSQSVAAPQTLTREDIETGAQLVEDLYRAATRIPGVASNDLSSAFHVRGGSNDELYATLDGVELLEPFHLKDFDGGLSILDVGAIGGVSLTTGGYGAEYGDRMSGVFEMRTVDTRPERPITTLAVSLTNLRGMSQGSFDDGKGGWLLSARRGYLEYALKLANEDNLKPTYFDGLAKVEYRLGDKHALSAHLLVAQDGMHLVDGPDDPVLDSEYSSRYAWLRWNADWSERVLSRTLFSFGNLEWQRHGIGISPLDDVQNLTVADDRSYNTGGVRQDWSFALSEQLYLRAGFQFAAQTGHYDYYRTERPAIIVDNRFSLRYDTTQVNLDPDGSRMGAYVTQRLRLWSPLTVEAGVRYDRYTHSDDAWLDPRVSASLRLGTSTTLRAAWGIYHQAEQLYRLQVQDGVSQFGEPERSEHRIVGVEQTLFHGLTARVEAYDKKLEVRPRFISLDHRLDGFPELGADRVLTRATTGNARGIEFFVKNSGEPFEWSASYGLAEARDRLQDGTWVPRDYDQRHAINADIAYRPSSSWRFATAWQYHSGWPITGYDYVRESNANNVEAAVIEGRNGPAYAITRKFHRRNSDRLPAYHRLDARLSRQFTTKRGRVLVYVDVFNVYNRSNPRALDRFVTFNNGVPNFGNDIDEQIPRLPSIGITWDF